MWKLTKLYNISDLFAFLCYRPISQCDKKSEEEKGVMKLIFNLPWANNL